MKDLLLQLLAWARSTLSPAQVCWLCIAATSAGGYFLSTQYVRADDLNALRADVRELSVQYLEEKMLALRALQCTATTDRSFHRERIAELQRRYWARTGRAFAVPTCQEM